MGGIDIWFFAGWGERRNKNLVGRKSTGWEIFSRLGDGKMSKFSAGRGSPPSPSSPHLRKALEYYFL